MLLKVAAGLADDGFPGLYEAGYRAADILGSCSPGADADPYHRFAVPVCTTNPAFA